MFDHAGQSSHESTTSNQGAERRDRAKGAKQLAVAVLPSILVVLVILVATGSPRLAPEGLLSNPWQILLWTLVAAVAALHRPFSSRRRTLSERPSTDPTLGFGALVLPAVLFDAGTVPAALVAGSSLLLAEAMLQSLTTWTVGSDNALGRLLPSLERAVLLAFTTLVVGSVVSSSTVAPLAPGLLAPVSGVLFTATLGGILFALARLRKKPGPRRAELLPMLLDGGAWAVGWLLADLLRSPDGIEGRWVWWILALLSAEAARNAVLRGLSDHRMSHFERLRQAHERILSETSGMGDIAQQMLEECRNILPVQWFQFTLFEEETLDSGPRPDRQSWAAGPDGLMVEGLPKPPRRPSMLPGIHRRAEWKIIERPLVRITPDDGEVLLARLRLWCDPRRIESGSEELLDTLVPQMASSVHRAMLDREAKLDPLTGVPVRRVLESRMQRAYRRCMEEGVPMAVIMCDIDFFKKVNDTYGHAAGDEALKVVASTLDTQRRDTDLCCRYGGEEFTILLERTHGDDALRLAERLRAAVEAIHFEFDGLHIPLTMSLGVASFPELHIKTVSELLLLADEALYEAKERGRNQCMLHIGNGAFRPFPGSRPQESSTSIHRPHLDQPQP